MEVRRILPLALGFYGAMAGVSLLWGFARGFFPLWWPPQMEPPHRVLEAGLGIAAGLVGVALSWLLDQRVPAVRELAERFGTIMAGLPASATWTLAAISGIGEEMFFRGCLQEELGLWAATLIFAVVHTGRERMYRWWTLSAFAFGLVMALLYERSGLLAPILMHATINGVNLRILSQRGVRASRGDGPIPLGEHLPLG